MVNQSGGHWIEPTNKTVPPKERSGEEIVNAQCIKCHGTGVSGAPKIGDRDAWIPRLKLGLDAVVRSAINGHGAMPARGGMPSASDAEMRRAVIYMFSQVPPPPANASPEWSTTPKPPPPPGTAPASGSAAKPAPAPAAPR